MKLLQVRIRGWTATFRLPLLYSGMRLSAPLPPYSTLLGLLGSLAGREVPPDETRIGFVFRCAGVATDLESLLRLQVDRKGRLKSHPERNVARRQFLVRPQLDLFLDNLDLGSLFETPQNPPCLGRSQDVAWIESARAGPFKGRSYEIVEAVPARFGTIRGTLVPFPQAGASGQILVLPDYFDNSDMGYTRAIGKLHPYQAVKFDTPANVEDVKEGELVCVESLDYAVYLHVLHKTI